MRPRIAALAMMATLTAVPVWAQTPAPATPAPPVRTIVGRQITLEEALAIALEAQPAILARLADYQAARLRVDQALSPLLPQLGITWSAATNQTATSSFETATGRRRTLSLHSDTTGLRLTASQLLFDFGKNYATVQSTRSLADVSLEDTELQRQLLAFSVKQSYTNMLTAQRLIRVNEQALARAELNLRSARGFFDVGTRPKSDVTRAEVDVANARVDVIRARNAERTARVALNVAMGLGSDTPTQIVDNLAYQPVVLDRGQLQTEAQRQRPEYRQAKLRADSQEAVVRRTKLDFFPDVTGSGNYGTTRADMNEVWELTLSLNWSLFDGGNRIARYREAQANFEGARQRVLQAALDIEKDVESSLIGVEEAQERIQAAQKAVESAQENYRLAQGRFDAGVGTILELTDAQLALTQAQNAETLALADYRVGLAQLDRSVGRR